MTPAPEFPRPPSLTEGRVVGRVAGPGVPTCERLLRGPDAVRALGELDDIEVCLVFDDGIEIAGKFEPIEANLSAIMRPKGGAS